MLIMFIIKVLEEQSKFFIIYVYWPKDVDNNINPSNRVMNLH